MLSGVHPELLAFGEPWLAREPGLLIGCRYAAAGAQRARVLAAQLLLRELAESAIAASDRRVAEARLQWWLEEAACWQRGHPRHPLAYGLDAPAHAPAMARLAGNCLEWLDQAPESVEALRTRLAALAVQTAQLAGCAAQSAASAWMAAGVRQSLRAPASLASLLPLDVCARLSLKRTQWGELDRQVRRRALAELAGCWSENLDSSDHRLGLSPQVGAAAHAALETLDRRWLARVGREDAERLGLGDVYAAWRAARRAA